MIAIAGSFLVASTTFAQQLNEVKVEIRNSESDPWELLCVNDDCSGAPALFYDVNFLPGDTVKKLVKITNEDVSGDGSGETRDIIIEAIDIENPYLGVPFISDKFGDILHFKVKASSTGNILYEKTLTAFFDENGDTFIATIDNNDSKEFIFSVYFDTTGDNRYQEKSLNFDILFGIEGEEGGSGGGNGGGGSGGGGGGLPPGLTIINESATSTGCTTATISWLTSYNSTSQVIYSTSPDQFILSSTTPNYGYDHASSTDDSVKVTYHTIKLTGLDESSTYYYRCVSHASPATIGYERSFTTCNCPVEEVIVLGEEGLAELTINKTVNTEFANAGDTINYKVNIANIGNMTAYNTILIDTLPTELSFIDGNNALKTWQIGDFEPGQTKLIEYDVLINKTAVNGIYTNLAQVSADNHELISAFANVNIELAPTGFSVKEFVFLILAFIIFFGLATTLRKKYLQ